MEGDFLELLSRQHYFEKRHALGGTKWASGEGWLLKRYEICLNSFFVLFSYPGKIVPTRYERRAPSFEKRSFK